LKKKDTCRDLLSVEERDGGKACDTPCRSTVTSVEENESAPAWTKLRHRISERGSGPATIFFRSFVGQITENLECIGFI
jgi:hypothetical protein